MLGYRINFFRDSNYRFHQGVVLEHVFPARPRSWITAFSGMVVIAYLLVLLAVHFSQGVFVWSYLELDPTTPFANGIFLMALAVFVLMKMLKYYWRS